MTGMVPINLHWRLMGTQNLIHMAESPPLAAAALECLFGNPETLQGNAVQCRFSSAFVSQPGTHNKPKKLILTCDAAENRLYSINIVANSQQMSEHNAPEQIAFRCHGSAEFHDLQTTYCVT